MDISDDLKLEEWFTIINATENTRKSYTTYFGMFCECANKTPSELIQESIQEIKQGLMPVERNVGGYVTKYKKRLSDKGYAPNTVNFGIASVRSFYKSFDIPLPSSATKTKKSKPIKENVNFIGKDDIINLLTNAPNLREKAIILCMATSGMARQEIISLKVGDISFDENDIGTINIRRQKAQTDYITFISPEATQALRNYWDERNRLASKKENITIEELHNSKYTNPEKVKKSRQIFAKNLKVAPDSSVFVTYETGDELSPTHFSSIFKNLGIKLGYDEGKGFVKTRSHALRKYFASTLEDNGFPKPKIDFMIGHTVSDTDTAYFNRSPLKLKKLYTNHLQHLTFEKEINVIPLDAKRFEEENEALKTDIQIMKLEHEQQQNTLNEKVKFLENAVSSILVDKATIEIGKEILKKI